MLKYRAVAIPITRTPWWDVSANPDGVQNTIILKRERPRYRFANPELNMAFGPNAVSYLSMLRSIQAVFS